MWFPFTLCKSGQKRKKNGTIKHIALRCLHMNWNISFLLSILDVSASSAQMCDDNAYTCALIMCPFFIDMF